MLKSGILQILFVFSRGFTIHRLPLLSSETCSGRKLYTSMNASPVYTQKIKTSRTSSSRSILNSFCHIRFISAWLRNCLFTSTSWNLIPANGFFVSHSLAMARFITFLKHFMYRITVFCAQCFSVFRYKSNLRTSSPFTSRSNISSTL